MMSVSLSWRELNSRLRAASEAKQLSDPASDLKLLRARLGSPTDEDIYRFTERLGILAGVSPATARQVDLAISNIYEARHRNELRSFKGC